tara:strand:+ start:1435 stop:1593 length:159 start_codon:yes stop_codon:yes gene_type:complete
MINILHSKIKDQEKKINDQEKLINEKNIFIKELKEQLEIKNRIIHLQDSKLF